MINASLISECEGIFSCPICSSPMKLVELKSLICAHHHCFDISKQGYLNLFPHALKTKYDKSMFESRRVICRSGFFKPLNERISEKIIQEIKDKDEQIHLLDAGCGEGSHLASIQERINGATAKKSVGVGVDISKEGISMASRGYSKTIWCVADLAKCPFVTKRFHFILNILSPSNYSEFQRLIADDGMIIKVIPEGEYLQELREIFYEQTNKQTYSNNTTLARFKANFKLQDVERIRYRFALDETLLNPLIQMTPLTWGTTEDRLQRILEMNLREITVDLTILFGKKQF